MGARLPSGPSPPVRPCHAGTSAPRRAAPRLRRAARPPRPTPTPGWLRHPHATRSARPAPGSRRSWTRMVVVATRRRQDRGDIVAYVLSTAFAAATAATSTLTPHRVWAQIAVAGYGLAAVGSL